MANDKAAVVSAETKKEAAYRTIFIVFLALGALTIIEYFAGLYSTSAVLMFILAFIKAALVVNFFMHVYRVWREDDH